MCALGGAAAGFLPFNYNPARIFMGDGGSLFIGFVLASASVMGTEKVSVAISLVVPLLVLALADLRHGQRHLETLAQAHADLRWRIAATCTTSCSSSGCRSAKW